MSAVSSLGRKRDFFGFADDDEAPFELVGMVEYFAESFKSLVFVGAVMVNGWKTPVASVGLFGSSCGIGVSGWCVKLGVGSAGAVIGVIRPAVMSFSSNKYK